MYVYSFLIQTYASCVWRLFLCSVLRHFLPVGSRLQHSSKHDRLRVKHFLLDPNDILLASEALAAKSRPSQPVFLACISPVYFISYRDVLVAHFTSFLNPYDFCNTQYFLNGRVGACNNFSSPCSSPRVQYNRDVGSIVPDIYIFSKMWLDLCSVQLIWSRFVMNYHVVVFDINTLLS